MFDSKENLVLRPQNNSNRKCPTPEKNGSNKKKTEVLHVLYLKTLSTLCYKPD